MTPSIPRVGARKSTLAAALAAGTATVLPTKAAPAPEPDPTPAPEAPAVPDDTPAAVVAPVKPRGRHGSYAGRGPYRKVLRQVVSPPALLVHQALNLSFTSEGKLMTQSEFADAIGASTRTLSRYLNDKLTPPEKVQAQCRAIIEQASAALKAAAKR